MEKASNALKTIEDFGPKMTLALLSSSKLGSSFFVQGKDSLFAEHHSPPNHASIFILTGKVIKKMTALGPDAIPNNDEFKIADRSTALLADWSKLAAGTTTANGDAAPSAEPAEATNGVAATEGEKMDVDSSVPPVTVPEAKEPEAKEGDTDAANADGEAEAEDVEMKVDAPAAAADPEPAAPVATADADAAAEPETATAA